MNYRKWEELKDRIRAIVPPGSEEKNIVDLAKALGVSRKKVIALEQDMDDFCMNVGIGFAQGGYSNLPKRDWSMENLSDTL